MKLGKKVEDSETTEDRKRRLWKIAAKRGVPTLPDFDNDEGYLRWLGGFFDGEGCVSIPETKKLTGYPYDYTLEVQIGGNFKEVLKEIKHRFGGSIHRIKDSEFGWRLCLSSNKALHFLEAIRPYIRLKWEEVDIGIKFQRDKVRILSSMSKSDFIIEMRRREGLSYRIQFLNRVRNLGPRVEE